MAKIRGLELPAEYNESLVEIMTTFPDEQMAEIGKRFLPGGIARAHLAREKIGAMLRSPAEIEAWMYSLLEKVVPGKEFIGKLTLEGIKPFIEALLKLWLRPNAVLPLLLDPRPEVQKFGVELVTKGLATEQKENKAEGKEEMVEFVNRYFLGLAGVEASIGPTSIVPQRLKTKDGEILTRKEFLDTFRATSDAFEKGMKTNKQLLRNLEEQQRKHKARMESTTRQAVEEKKRLLTERDQALSRARRAEKEKAALDERVRQADSKQEATLARGLEEQTSAVVRKWLRIPLEFERQAQESEAGATNLLARAETALQAQAEQDRLTGNRRDLERKLEELREVRDRLAEAACTALRPGPELKGLLAEVEEQMQGVQKIISSQRVQDPLTERLLLTINHAADAEQTRECSQFVEQAADLELVPRADRRRLVDALQRKFSVLEEMAKGPRFVPGDNGWALRGTIYRDQPSLILLDGFNILFGMEDIFRPDYEPNGRPGRRATQRLVTLTRRLTDSRSGLRVRVLFDSPEHEVVALSPNLTVEFSGGQGEHRADQRIAELLEFRRPEELEEKWYVVSDDRAVRRQAAVHKAQPVSVDVFAVLLGDFGCLSENTKAGVNESKAA